MEEVTHLRVPSPVLPPSSSEDEEEVGVTHLREPSPTLTTDEEEVEDEEEGEEEMAMGEGGARASKRRRH